MRIDIITVCPICKEETYVSVESADFEAWQNGALIQNVMWYLSPKERETLISGICSICWDKMFSEEDDEPEEFDYDFADTYMDIGYNPYLGCYDEDC